MLCGNIPIDAHGEAQVVMVEPMSHALGQTGSDKSNGKSTPFRPGRELCHLDVLIIFSCYPSLCLS